MRIKRLIAILVLAAATLSGALSSFAHAQFFIGGSGVWKSNVVAGGGPCSQYTAFATRATAAGSTLTGSDITNYTNLICTMVTNGTFAKKEGFYNLAAPNTTLALLDLTAHAHNLALIGSPAFSAYNGYTGGAGVALDTGVILSSGGGLFTLNSAILGGWSNVNLSSANEFGGAVDGSAVVGIAPFTGGSQATFFINDGGASISSGASIGHYVINRNGASTAQAYKNGANLGTYTAPTSISVPTTKMLLLALGFTGGTVVNNWPGQLSFGYFGGSHTATDVANDCHTLNVYLTAVNGNAAVC